MSLPGGNGRSGGATAATLRELKDGGLIEYGKEQKQSYYGYRLTDAGREALSQSRRKGE